MQDRSRALSLRVNSGSDDGIGAAQGARLLSDLFVAMYYGRSKLLDCVKAAIPNDGHERHSLVQEIVRRLQRLLSGILNDFRNPLRLTRLALQHNHVTTHPCGFLAIRISHS